MHPRIASFWATINPPPIDMAERIRLEAAQAMRLHNAMLPDEPYSPPVAIDVRNPLTAQPWFRHAL